MYPPQNQKRSPNTKGIDCVIRYQRKYKACNKPKIYPGELPKTFFERLSEVSELPASAR
jgi:hypothetical protein